MNVVNTCSPLDGTVSPKGNQPWIFIGRADVEAETPILWPPDAKSWLIGKDPDAGKDLKAGGEGDDRGWDGWMASATQWTWVWVDSGSRWWTGRPGVLWFMGSQRVAQDWATELNFSISPSNEYSGLISFRTDCAIQGTARINYIHVHVLIIKKIF